ncbi:TylF/MycF/NovP-related O-methyltransferase [Roseibium sediminis]|uniref:TylF/MycF/NovP-related O-methyltransferase n=1 Tax=Roseibium sediminis TaxID=1775174 RepID=UPI00123D3966|nr:TylF/MycF/NovP-related O-methyltransferase [Roseibium sediminis]
MSDLSERHEPEKRQRDALEKLFSQTQLSPFDLFRNFPVVTPRFNLARFLAHYEIFKKIIDVPGVIVDLGVYRGSSTFTWAKLCEIFCPTDIRKTVVGFDTFTGFAKLSAEDGPENPEQDVIEGGYFGGDSVECDLALAQKAMNFDRHLRHKDRIQFVKGDVCETIPKFVEERGDGLRISLLNLDLDLYEPTAVALEHMVPRMARGGIIVVDEYAVDTFGGESRAVDEYFIRCFGKRPRVVKFPWHSNPTGYIEVDW